MRILFALAIILVARLCLACLEDGQNCAHTVSVCCEGLVPSDPDRMTPCHCIPGEETTTTTTPTTTTEPGSTSTTTATSTSSSSTAVTFTTTTATLPPTTTTLPATAGYPDAAMLLTPTDLRITDDEPPAYTGHLVDPRTGLPANQLVLATMGWELMADAADFVNMADVAGCRVNDNQLDDALWKFGLNYVLNHTGGDATHGTYQWMQPTYVRQYTLGPLATAAECLQKNGGLSHEMAQLAGLETGDTSPPPADPDPGIRSGILTYSPGHYAPLTDIQCAALQRAEDAHMAHDQALLDHDFDRAAANNPAVNDTQRAFEATARDINDATLFKFVWNGTYNFANPQDVLDGLTIRIMAHHAAVTAAYNCATHTSPNVTAIVEQMLWHNQLHWCRATTHNLDRAIRTVCTDQPIDDCPRLTCREQAAL